MEIDLDPLEDIFADEGVKNARPVGKFQPKAKAKLRPIKRDVAAPSVSSSQPAQTTATVATDLDKPVKGAKPSENWPEVVFNDNEHGCAPMEKPVVEIDDILIGMETLGDILPNNTTDMEGPAPLSESEVSDPNKAKAHVLPVPDFPEDIIHRGKGGDVLTCPELSTGLDPFTAAEPIVFTGDGCGPVHDGELHTEEMDIMDSINASELTTKSGLRRGKFPPKQKLKMQKKIHESDDPVSCSLVSQSDQPESNYTEEDSVHVFRQDDMLDLSDLGLNHTLPTEDTLEIPLDKESVDHMEATQIDSGVNVDVEPEIPVKLPSRRANKRSKTETAPAPSSQQHQASTSGEDNEICRSLRPRKSRPNLCELVDEVEEEVAADGDISDELLMNSAAEEENVNGESVVEKETQKEKVKRKRKPKKPDDGKEKPARKRKKAEEALDKNEGAKPKKFSHSTRRRRVDKALLETPEDELDYQKLTLRDLILLAEHKEQQTKKEVAAVAGATTTNQSNGNSESQYQENETFNTRQHGEYNDGEDNPEMEDTTVYFNYHSHMDRTPISRWSKQETELFYEAVQQFGTDLSMIQQLFPDRTRRQIKLKYKKEERQQPLRLREALSHRSTDHSYFEKVIEHLQKMDSEENQDADDDDNPIDLTRNEVDEEGASNVDKEESKEEQIEVEQKEDATANEIEVESPSNFDECEDDGFFWSQYKSDT